MCRIQHRRALPLVATLVAISMLLAPTASLASCCCVLAKISVAVGMSPSGCCGDTDKDSCCPSASANAASENHGCCNGRVLSPTTITPKFSFVVRDHASSTQCECERSCCDGVSNLSPAIQSEKPSAQSLSDDAVATPLLWAAYDSVPASTELRIDRSPPFLSSPHRCATLCRWLN